MKRYLQKTVLIFLTAILCLADSLAEDLQLNDMSAHEESVQEDLQYSMELYAESDAWKTGAVLLNEAEYTWVGETREMLNRYFADTYDLDISPKTANIEVYVSNNLPEWIGGFSDGEGHVYINRNEIERVPERMLQILTHEMVHALGVDFYGDESGMLSNGFFEGVTEAAVQIVLETCGHPYEDFSGYDEVRTYGEQILHADPMLIFDFIEGNEHNIAHRIDVFTGEGCGRILLECELLLSTGPDAPEIAENCALIVQKYAENISKRGK